MGRLGVAFRAFWRALGDAAFADAVRRALQEGPSALPPPVAPPREQPPERPEKASARSEALNLLAALQREARFVDFIKEPLSEYSDAQIGAAVRDIHRDCAAALERWFGLRPVLDQAEGSPVEVPAGYDAGRYRLTGNVAGPPPYRGSLAHHGWEAARSEMPEWTGGKGSALVVAPAEVEIK
jgi:hypothetical protein